MATKERRFDSAMRVLMLISLLPLMYCEQMGMLDSLPAELLAGLMSSDPMLSEAGMGGGSMLDEALKEVQSVAEPLEPLLRTTPEGAAVVDAFSKAQGSSASEFKTGYGSLPLPLSVGVPTPGLGKMWKAAAPLKKVTLKKAKGVKVVGSKVKAKAVLKKKPKVYSLKPIVHVIEKPVPVFHKVPIPKKVIIPKFYPVKKPIPVPKIIPVPFKVPIKKIIPKIVKIPKAIPVPKFVPVKKYIPIGIPYPVPKVYKVPVMKPVPYPKFIPIPIPKKVPKFVPFPVKKIIKVPKPFYVPIKVPYITASYVKAPMVVNVPYPTKQQVNLAVPVPTPVKVFEQQEIVSKEKVKLEEDHEIYVEKEEPVVNFISTEDKDVYKMKDTETDKIYSEQI